MTSLPFEDPKAKVSNARDHIQLVEARIASFAAKTKPVTRTYPGGAVEVILKGDIEPPANVALAVGDAIHNLRSALDHMAGDVVQASGKSRKGVYFPMAGFKEGLEKQIADKNFNRAIPEAVTLLRSFKPYKGGNALLRALHDLDVTDKHIFVLRPDRTAKVPYMTIGTNIFHNCEIGTIRTPQGTPISIEGEITHVLRFRQGVPLAGEEVVQSLHRMADLTDTIIEAFKALFR